MRIKESLIRLRSFEYNSLEENIIDIKKLSEKHDILLGGIVYLPTKKTRYTLLRSPHVNKQSREQFEIRRYTRLLRIKSIDKDKVISFVEEVQSICSANVAIKVTFGFQDGEAYSGVSIEQDHIESLLLPNER